MSSPKSIFAALAAVLVASLSCKNTSSENSDAGSAASTANCGSVSDQGWLTWLASDPAGPKRLQDANGGWISLYQRAYREALTKFDSSGSEDARVGQVRIHIHLGTLALELSQLLARAQVRYFEARAKLGQATKPLVHGPYFHGVSEILLGVEAGHARLQEAKKDLPVPYPDLASAFPKACTANAVQGKDSWQVFAELVRCASTTLPKCPAGLGPSPKLQAPWADRAHAYYQALCEAPAPLSEDSLLELAQTPAAVESVKGQAAGETIEAEVELFDPLALWALGQLHLRKAEDLAAEIPSSAALLGAWAQWERHATDDAKKTLANHKKNKSQDLLGLVMTPWADFNALKTAIEQANTPANKLSIEAVRQEATKRGEKVIAALDCHSRPEGKKFVNDLDLGASLVDGLVRERSRETEANPEMCDGALRLLRATLDSKVTDRISFRNEPRFLIRLAQAATCMGRSSEAIGALRAVRTRYPEATGVLQAVESLAVVRQIGGTGEQKTQ